MKKFKIENIVPYIFVLCVFIFFYVWFSRVHPIIVFDADDWQYVTYQRAPWPLWGEWNPTRVFAECFMPLVSNVSVKLLCRSTDTFFTSLTKGYAFAVSLVLSVLIYMIIKLLIKRYQADYYKAVICVLLFIISNFWILRTGNTDNLYMLYTSDACTYFYYVIPNIINCIFVCCLMMDEELLDGHSSKSAAVNAVLVILAYFCIFSNIWAGILSAVYIALMLLETFIKEKKNKSVDYIAFIKNQWKKILFLFVWFVSQIFEMFGGRADSLAKDFTLGSIIETFIAFINVCRGFNLKFVIVIFVICFFGIVLMIKSGGGNRILQRYRKIDMYRNYRADLSGIDVYCYGNNLY